MATIDDVKALCDRLAPKGWKDFLLEATDGALNISQPSAKALRQELTKRLQTINRDSLPGLEDFDPSGKSAVTPGQPSQSLLYHALASPLVLRDHQGRMLQAFPTPTELDVLENFIFSLSSIAWAQFVQQHGGTSNIAVAVFATEYRPASDSVDGHHADLTFSRTGIARIGTARPLYLPHVRGFWPEDEDNPHNIRVVPVRFSAWLAVKTKGSKVRVSPILDNSQAQTRDEPNRNFWVPIHKLFPGTECLQGSDVQVRLTTSLSI